MGINEALRVRFQGGAVGGCEVLLRPVKSMPRMSPIPSAHRTALMPMGHMSPLLCSQTQASFLLYSPLSDMQKNMTFTKGQYALSKNFVTSSKGTFSVGGMKSFIVSNLNQQCPRGNFWLEAQSHKHVELHLFYRCEELGLT